MRRGHRSNVFAVLLDAPCLEGFRRLEAEYGEDFRADTPTRAFVYDVKAVTADIARKARRGGSRARPRSQPASCSG